jgi:hypothetical protein
LTPRSYTPRIACLVPILFPLAADAACQETLAEVDRKLASAEIDAGLRPAIQQFRDQGAEACAQGHEPTAMQTLQIVSMMLDRVAAEQEEAARRAAPPPPPPPPPPIEEQLASGRAEFPNRWDKLSQLGFCQWLTTDELERELDFHAPLSCRDTGKGFVIESAVDGDSWPEQVFMLIVEVHPTQETVRRAETNTSEGFSTKLFTPFDAGTPELHVYLANRGHYLYAFPAGGLTLWRLEYLRPGPKRDRYYLASPGRSGSADLGPRFMEMLVDKYADRL